MSVVDASSCLHGNCLKHFQKQVTDIVTDVLEDKQVQLSPPPSQKPWLPSAIRQPSSMTSMSSSTSVEGSDRPSTFIVVAVVPK